MLQCRLNSGYFLCSMRRFCYQATGLMAVLTFNGGGSRASASPHNCEHRIALYAALLLGRQPRDTCHLVTFLSLLRLLLLPPQAIPQVATAPVLVLVGAMMMGESTHIDWSSMMTAVPAFLTIVIQPFTFSIANGIYAGLVMSILLYLLTGSFLETLGFSGFGGSKEAAVADEDLEAYIPVLDGQEYAAQQTAAAAAAAGASAVAIEDSNGINVHRRSSAASVPVGSLPHGSRGTPYERGSFSMYINTFGSHTASPGRFVLGSQMGAGSHVGSHMGSEEPEH
jgi:AGZA family xanthine/uracil permease-like MFS transporter